MNYEELASKILKLVGGKSNINSATNCATRLRFILKDQSKVNEDELKKTKGVMGIAKAGGQFQIIIGNDVVNVYSALKKVGNLNFASVSEDDGSKKEKGNAISNIIAIIAGIFTPVLAGITAAGMLKAVMALLIAFNLVSADSETYYVLNFISDAAFYFLPILLAFSAGLKFNTNPYLAAVIGGVLLHPNLTSLIGEKASIGFFGIPISVVTYSSSVIPIILAVWLLSYIDRFSQKISPKPLKFFLVPLLDLIIVAPITLIALGPLGSFIGQYIAIGVTFLSTHLGWALTGLMGVASPLLVMFGMHYSLFPIVLESLGKNNYDALMSPAMLASNIAQGGAALAVSFKTKNKELKSIAVSTGITAILGITEPAMYGVNLKLKKPLIAVLIGGGVGGLYSGITMVKSFGFVSPGLLALPVYISPDGTLANLINAIISMVIAFIVAFVVTLVLGFEDPIEEIEGDKTVTEDNTVITESTEINSSEDTIYSPIKGETKLLSEVSDKVIAEETLGKGIAIYPSEGIVYSPIDGTLVTIFNTYHALGLRSNNGTEILIHVGIDTVKLNGKHFKPLIKDGDIVTKGQPLLEFDMDAIKNEGYDIITPIIVTNSQDYSSVELTEKKNVNVSDILLKVK